MNESEGQSGEKMRGGNDKASEIPSSPSSYG